MKKLLLSLALICGLAIQGYAAKYELVTSAENLRDGLKVIIVNTSSNKALSTTQTKYNRGAADVTITNNVIEPGSDVQIIELVKSGDNYSLCVGESQYLYAASSSSNYLKTQSTAVPASITITNNNATIKFTGSYTCNLLKYNSSSNIFSCYASGQQAVQIYAEKDETPAGPVDYVPGIEDNATINMTVGETKALATPAPQLSVDIVNDPETVDVVTIDGTTITATNPGLAMVTLGWSADNNWNVGSVSFMINVSAPKTDPVISFASESLTYTLGTDAEINGVVAGQTLIAPSDCKVSYSSDKENVVTVAADGKLSVKGAGTATITATVAADETYNEASKTYTVTIIDPNVITYTDVLTVDSFNPTGTGYMDGRIYTSPITGIKYDSSIGCAGGIQMNYKAARGIIVVENPNGYVLTSATVEWDSSTANTRGIVFYGSESAFTSYADKRNGTVMGTATKSDNKTLTFDGNYQFIGLDGNGSSIKVSSITLVWEKVAADAIANPVFTVDMNKVSLSCETEGAEIHYTLDGTPATAESPVYDGTPIEVYTPTTISAIAVKGEKESKVVNREFNMYVFEDFNILGDITEDYLSYDFVFTCPMTVIYQGTAKRRMYLANGGSNMFVYSRTNMPAYNAGDVINGAAGKFEIYNGLLEFVPTSFGEVTGTAEVPEPHIIATGDVQTNMMHQYVKLLNVTITAGTKNNYYVLTDSEDNTVECYNGNSLSTVPTVAGKTYDVTGFVGIFSTTLQIVPTEIVEHEVPEVPSLHVDTPWPSDNRLEAGAKLKYTVAKGFIQVRIVERAAGAPRRVASSVTEQGEAPANWEYLDDKTAVYTHPALAEGESLPVYDVVNVHNGEESVPTRLELTADGGVSGIVDVTVDGGDVEYYNLQGVRVENPAPGLYIRRQGDTYTKVLVK